MAGAQVQVTAYNAQWAYISRAEGNGFVPLSAILPGNNAVVRTRNGVVILDTNVYETAAHGFHRDRQGLARRRVHRAGLHHQLGLRAQRQRQRGLHEPLGHHPLRRRLHGHARAHALLPVGDGTPATVTVDRLDVYATPSTQGEYLGSIAYGTQVTVLDHDGTWALVTPDGSKYGYCLLSGLTANDQFGSGTAATVTVDFLTVYRSASASSPSSAASSAAIR